MTPQVSIKEPCRYMGRPKESGALQIICLLL